MGSFHLFEPKQGFELSDDGGVSFVKNAVYTGKYRYGFDDMVLDEKVFSDFKKNFDSGAYGIAPAINYNHDMFDKAAGWIKSVDIRELEEDAKLSSSKKRYAIDLGVEWTPAAAKAIRDGEYRYFSIEFAFDYKNSETGKVTKNVITGGALTNKPFLKGTVLELQEVAENKKEVESMNIAEIKGVLLSDHSINLDELVERSKRLSEVESELEKAEEKIEELEKEVKEAEAEAEAKEVEAVLSDALSSGKATKHLCDSVLRAHFLSIGSDAAKKIVSEMPVIVKIEPKGATLSDDVKEGETVDEKRHRLALAEAEKSGISYMNAVNIIDEILLGGKI